ncbi:MAG TPA: hypothetical protein DEQ02_05005 [Ruminococcaceae bacterium]|nr:hypothetical protein [Oscillospiraceae bacterium]
MSLASGERETAEIRLELTEQGYLKGKKQTGKKGGRIPKKPASLPPRKFVTGGGLVILCGRNNRQNDELTLRLADKEDIWLHVKNLPGSHVILRTGGKQASEQDIVSAAEVAAAFSKAPEGVPVPVDYTAVRRVKKLPGGKPGMVTYDRFKTVYVTSDPKRVETLCT